MPYIAPERRPAIDPIIDGLVARLRSVDAGKGDLNYTVTRIVLGALIPEKGWNYRSLSDAVGALKDAATEIERRMLAPHEDAAAAKNGDLIEFTIKDGERLESLQRLLDKFRPLPVTVIDVESRPVADVAAEQFQDLQSEIKEAFERR